jgi:hypothetical protein
VPAASVIPGDKVPATIPQDLAGHEAVGHEKEETTDRWPIRQTPAASLENRLPPIGKGAQVIWAPKHACERR